MKKLYTDEQIIDAFLKHRSYNGAADELKTDRMTVMGRVQRMIVSGVKLPVSDYRGTYTPDRVRRLNAYIEKNYPE